ncbi:MAG TPA: class I SAM-dependent methyltransferase [Candidatus Saccharimonadales bacterium]|nr:class I SAM-dependent methyltransferase [Candidatus Saccharimonadales bacterium]
MTEHFRSYLDPIDTYAEPILHPEHDVLHRGLIKYGNVLMERLLGAELVSDNEDGQTWKFSRGGQTAAIDIHEPDVVIPALIRYRDLGLFYTYTGEKEPLWEPNTTLTEIPPEVDTGHPEADSMAMVGELLLGATQGVRQAGYTAANLLAPFRDMRSRLQWQMSTARTKEEIHAHYDVSQDIYVGPHGFLDAYVQYSAGLLPPDGEFTTLEDLQERKIQSLINMLELESADTLLEIGTGWGGLITEIADHVPHIEITSLTLSGEQAKRARARIKEAGHEDRVKVLERDYRDLKADGFFDRLVTVEMIEAVAWQDMDVFFDALTNFVDPEIGRIAIQSINLDPRRFAAHKQNEKNFSNKAIFPGGILTPRGFIEDEMAKRNFELEQKEDLGISYAYTLREWLGNMWEHKDALTQQWLNEGVPAEKIERFYRGMTFYLAFCEAGFRTGHLEDWQQVFTPA